MTDATDRGIPVPDELPVVQDRTFVGPRDHSVPAVASSLAPTFDVEVDLLARRRKWGAREKVTLRATGNGPAVARFWSAVEDAIPQGQASRSLWDTFFDW